MRNIVITTALLSLVFSRATWSDEAVEVRDMGQMLAQIKLEKKQMDDIVDKLASSGRISPENAVRAKREIASVKEEDAEEVKSHVVSMISTRQKN